MSSQSVGGDGLIHEVLNGLMDREDNEQAIKIPIGIIPAGSQNALAMSACGTVDTMKHTLAIIKGYTRPMDLISITFPERGLHMYGLVVTAWGFVGSVGKAAEKLRFLGPSRYIISAIKAFATGINLYRSRISYIPADLPSLSTPIRSSTPTTVTRSASSSLPKATNTITSPRISKKLESIGERALTKGTSAQNYNSLQMKTNQTLSSEWRRLDIEVFNLMAFNVSGRNTQTPAPCPDADIADGCLSLLLWHSCSRLDIVKYLFKQYTGRHIDLNFLEIFKVCSVIANYYPRRLLLLFAPLLISFLIDKSFEI